MILYLRLTPEARISQYKVCLSLSSGCQWSVITDSCCPVKHCLNSHNTVSVEKFPNIKKVEYVSLNAKCAGVSLLMLSAFSDAPADAVLWDIFLKWCKSSQRIFDLDGRVQPWESFNEKMEQGVTESVWNVKQGKQIIKTCMLNG